MNDIKHHYINGAWVNSDNHIENINPSDLKDCIGNYASGDERLIHQAVEAATQAFGEWSQSNIQMRSNALDFIGNEILARATELGELLAREEGKTLPEAIGEVNRAGQIFKFFSGECLRLKGETVPSIRPSIDINITREPIGVVGLITPWNFPIAIPAWKVAPALAFGNCVVLKPAELVSGSAWALAEIISRSGIPKGVFNLVMGKGRILGNALVEHPGVAGISFTGSVTTGREIAVKCAARQAKVQLEMGGKNPQIVLDDANLEAAVELSVQSAFYSTGQRCTASSRLIVTDKIYPQFIEKIQQRLANIRVGHALDKSTDMGPVVSESQLEQNLSYLQIAKDEGAKLAFGGNILKRETAGYFMEPALFVDTSSQMRINREEVFGPVASILRASNYEHALQLANDTEFGLSAGIATQSLKYARDFQKNSKAGMVMVNLPTAGVDYHVPFGGCKSSSYGSREQGSYAQEFYTTVKTSYLGL